MLTTITCRQRFGVLMMAGTFALVAPVHAGLEEVPDTDVITINLTSSVVDNGATDEEGSADADADATETLLFVTGDVFAFGNSADSDVLAEAANTYVVPATDCFIYGTLSSSLSATAGSSVDLEQTVDFSSGLSVTLNINVTPDVDFPFEPSCGMFGFGDPDNAFDFGDLMPGDTVTLSIGTTVSALTNLDNAEALAFSDIRFVISDAPIAVGACRFIDSQQCFEEILEESCLLKGGEYLGDDSLCPGIGACCSPIDGVCTFDFEDLCTDLGGVFQGDLTDCSPNPCDPAGACCFGDSCEIYTESFCMIEGGCYRGDFTTCSNFSSGNIALELPEGVVVEHTITVPNIGTVDDLRVFVDVSLEGLTELTLWLKRGDTVVELYNDNCTLANGFRARFRDGGTPINDVCPGADTGGIMSPPALQPNEDLSAFDSMDIAGEWTLCVEVAKSLPGTLNRWRLNFPNVTDAECIDCNMDGTDDFCETTPVFDPAAAMPQDLCIDAEQIGPGIIYPGDTAAANSDAFIFCGAFFSLFDQYYAYTPRSTGHAFVSVADMGPEVYMISIHTECPPTEGNMIACSFTQQQGVGFDVQKGDEYIIRVAALGNDTGMFNLELFGPPALTSEVDDNEDGVPDECECRADVNGDGTVDVTDLMQVMDEQGPCAILPPDCPSDVNLDGEANELDIAAVINAFGPCPFDVPMMAPALQPAVRKGAAPHSEFIERGRQR